jgi:hypothetical protein
MADDKMRDQDRNRNLGGRGTEDEAARSGQQSPGRNPNEDQSTSKRPGGDKPANLDEDEDEGTGGRQGNQGGQRR